MHAHLAPNTSSLLIFLFIFPLLFIFTFSHPFLPSSTIFVWGGKLLQTVVEFLFGANSGMGPLSSKGLRVHQHHWPIGCASTLGWLCGWVIPSLSEGGATGALTIFVWDLNWALKPRPLREVQGLGSRDGPAHLCFRGVPASASGIVRHISFFG
jgi:hypothetical protein